jgi:hypothetical protein
VIGVLGLRTPSPGSDLLLPVRRLAKERLRGVGRGHRARLRGVVAKEEASLYEAGPTRRWLKVKQHGRADAEDRWQQRISTAPTAQ